MKQINLYILTLFVAIVAVGQEQKAKYVFFFIADGMGPHQVQATEAAFGKKLHMTQLPVSGEIKTDNAAGKTTDSAAAGTALAVGHKAKNGIISVDSQGKPLKTIAQLAKENGLKVGILSTVSLDHATPAAFYAHAKSRNNYKAIAAQLPKSPFEYFAGGGLKGKRVDALLKDDKSITLATGRDELPKLKPGMRAYATSKRKSGGASMPWVLDKENDELTLAELVETGIRLLDNPNGFFMMIEGGKIDWAGHANALGTVVHQVKAFDESVAVAVQFAKKHPDETLIVVTADHETGGLKPLKQKGTPTILATATISHEVFASQVKKLVNSDKGFDELLTIAERYGLASLTEAETAELKKSWDAKSARKIQDTARKVLAAKAGYTYTTGGHSGVAVPIYASGPGADYFTGVFENTEVPRRIAKAMQLSPAAVGTVTE